MDMSEKVISYNLYVTMLQTMYTELTITAGNIRIQCHPGMFDPSCQAFLGSKFDHVTGHLT